MRTASISGLFKAFLLTLCALLLLASGAQAQPTLGKSFVPDTIGPGSVSTLTFNINNASSSVARDVAFTDNLPAGMTVASPSNIIADCQGFVSATEGGSSISFSEGAIASFGTCTISVNVTSSTAGTHSNTTSALTSDAGSSGAASADLTVDTDRPGFTKSFSPNTVFFGDRSTLTFTIDNSANGAQILNLTFTDNLPTGMTIASPANASTTCTGGEITAPGGGNQISYRPLIFNNDASVDANSICTVSVDVVAGAVGPLGNISEELTGFSFGNFQTLSSGRASAVLTATVEQIAVSKTFTDDPAAPGETVTLEYTVRNLDRRSSATNIAFNDDFDGILSGLAVSSAPSQPCGAGSSISGSGFLSLSGGQLATGSTCTFSVTLQVPTNAIAGNYSSTTSVITADVGGSSAVGNPATDILAISPVPTLSKTFLDNPVGAGNPTVLEFTITNTSPTFEATNIAFEDVFDVVMPTASVTPDNGFCGPGSTAVYTPLVNPPPPSDSVPAKLTVSGASLAAGASCTFTITLDVAVGAATGSYLNTTSEITATVSEESVSGDPATDTLDVIAAPRIEKAFIDDPVTAGSTVTLQFILTHDENAPAPATDITFSDDLSAALAGLVATGLPQSNVCGVGSLLDGTESLLLTGGNLTAGESCTFIVTLQVPTDAAPGNYVNTTSSVVATVLGETVMENGGTDTLSIAGLTLTKEFVDDPAFPGGTVELQFTLENLSPDVTATDIVFIDDLDDALNNLAATSGSLPQNDICGVGSSLIALGANTRLLFAGGSLDPATSCTFSVILDIPPGTVADFYTNVTSGFSATFDGATIVPDNAIDTLEVVSDFLMLEKEFLNDPVSPGDNVVLRFTVTNLLETGAVSELAFTDDLDAALAGLVSVSGTQSNVCGTGSEISGTSFLTFSGGNLSASGSCVFDVILDVPNDVALGSEAVNTTSEISGSFGGLSITGNQATDTLLIDSLEFSKSFSAEEIEAGDAVVLTFNIQNLDLNGGISGLAFSDNLSVIPGTVAIDLPKNDVCGVGSSLTGTTSILFDGGSLLPGGSCTFSVTLQTSVDVDPGSYENVTSTLQQGEDRNRVADEATDTIVIVGATSGGGTLYCADDVNNRDTQVFAVDLDTDVDTSIGPVQPLADLETLIAAPNGLLYGITAETGELWTIDKTTGALTSVCTIPSVRKFREIASSSFHPTTGELWVYQWNRGLASVDLGTCALTREWNQPYVAGTARKWDGLAWRPDGTVVYGSQRTDLYAWDPITEIATVICSNLPDKTEGLEYTPDGDLYGSSDSTIYKIEPDTCTVFPVLDLPNRQDIESLTFEE